MPVALVPAARPGVKRLCNCRLTASTRIHTFWSTASSPCLPYLLPSNATLKMSFASCFAVLHVVVVNAVYMPSLVKTEYVLPIFDVLNVISML